MKKLVLVTLLLASAGALGGYCAGPFLARGNDTVLLAERIARENAQMLSERTLESEAFRGTAETPERLFAEAKLIEQRFRIGGSLFGAFCGLVIGMKLLAQAWVQQEPFYHMDREACVSCGRCFIYCPTEKLRLKNLVHD